VSHKSGGVVDLSVRSHERSTPAPGVPFMVNSTAPKAALAGAVKLPSRANHDPLAGVVELEDVLR
jgi:hypothetical protein